jgi:hypothetical protein
MMYNSDIPLPLLYPIPGQQEPTLHVTAPMHHNMMMQTPNTLKDVSNRQRQHRLTSTSEDEDDTHHNINNEWQVILRTKRKKIHSTPLPTPNTLTETHNRYGLLSNVAKHEDTEGKPRPPQIINLHPSSSTELSIMEK